MAPARPPVAKVVGGAWIPQGPGPAHFGQPENIPNQPISGAIEAVVAHPTNADVVWIGAVNGGVFRSDDASAANPSWIRLTDAQTSLSIAALALDPTDPSFNTLVAGIGRTSSLASLGGPRSGLLRSTDDGTTWTELSAIAGRNNTGVAARGNVIVVAVANADAFTCGEVGIWRSVDSGASFTQISNNVGVTGLPCGLSFDLASDPTDNTRLFTSGTQGGSGAVYRSTDTGATWTKVSNAAMDALLFPTCPSRVEISVGTAGGAGANVFAAICSAGRLAGLFRSGNAGATWTTLDLPSTTEMGTSFGIHPGGQCGIHMSIAADPSNHNVVFLGGDRQPANNENGMPGVQFPNSIGASNFGGRLFRVDAGQPLGSQATPITNCSTASAACGGAIRTVSDPAPHADSRELVFDANGDLIQTDDGGIYRHSDPNGSTGDWLSVIGNLPVNEQHDSAYDTVSNVLVSGNQDNGTTIQTTPGNVLWEALLGGDGGDVAVAANDPVVGQSTRYVSAQNLGNLVRVVYDSSNVLQSFVFPTLTPLGGSPAVAPQFITPLKVNAITPSRVILGAGNGLYESLDRLNTVTQLVSGGGINFLDGGGPMDYGAIGDASAFYFVGGQFVISTTAGAGFRATDPDGASTDNIAGVVMDPASSAAAFVIDANQVFRTTNGNISWTDITGNLQTFNPGILRSIEYLPSAAGDGLVVGGTAGVFVALAGSGFTLWDRLAALPNAAVFNLDYDSADDVLAAGTLGRGAWKLDSASFQIHNQCNQTVDLVPNQWKQISLACNPGGLNTVAQVFGDDLSGIYGTNWVVFRRDAVAQNYVQMATTDILNVGEAYWIITNLVAPTVDTGSTFSPVSDIALVTSTADSPAGCGNSAGRCNMVGHPHPYDVCWADVQVVDGANTLSLAEADLGGACQAASAAANGCVMSRIAHKWTGASYATFDGTTLGMEGTTVPWDGFWVSAVKSGISLRIPAFAGGPGLPCGNPKSALANGWYIRLTAESGALRDVSNVFGQLADSAQGFDSHDLEELVPFGDAYLTVVFPHANWGNHAGDYGSDYHPLQDESAADAWSFEVRSSDPEAQVTLGWQGPSSRLLGSVLTDLRTGERIAVAGEGSYTFAMNGSVRRFGWVVRAARQLIFADGFESGDTSRW